LITKSVIAGAGLRNRLRAAVPIELRLSKATVSKAISRIERKLGARLFNRAARRLAVTEAGRQLYDRPPVFWPKERPPKTAAWGNRPRRAATCFSRRRCPTGSFAWLPYVPNFWNVIPL
jgi:hypothetical protein